ncbi:MAG: 3-dehydroquinate synthase [Rikenellaceae bacterium]
MEDVLKIKRGDGGYSSVIFDKFENHIKNYTEGKRVIIITDENVFKYYSKFISGYDNIIIQCGENNKTINAVSNIYNELLKLGADRHSYIVGFGGGIVTDITGFVASTFMRGVEFGFVASTLLAQVDASVGGKNGVNFLGFKNMIGVFNQPKFVICDVELLSTLPKREFAAGLSELIKAALIADISLFEDLETKKLSEIINDTEFIKYIVKRSVEIKAMVVEKDEQEHGLRKKLNLGHSFAHAIEKSTSEFLHGEAVSLGLVVIADLCVKMGRMTQGERNRVVNILNGMELPTACRFSYNDLKDILKSDKKKNGESIDLVLFDGLEGVSIEATKFTELDELVFAGR